MKNFDEWNIIKKKIEEHKRAPVRKGEIYWCRIGLNVGVEQDGKDTNFQRPVLVLKKFSNEIVLCMPLTSKKHGGDWYYHLPNFGKNSYGVLNQIKPVDTKRFMSSMGEVSEAEIAKILISYFNLLNK